MSKYRITVEAEGPLRTTDRDNPLDADRLLSRFRQDLISGGHQVTDAELTIVEEEGDEDEDELEDDDQGDEDDDNEATGPGGV